MNTRETIIEKAMILFLQRGYDQVSVELIAKEVGIKKPSLYYHFKSKDEIFQEVVNCFFREGNEWMKSFSIPENSFKDALYQLFQGLTFAISEIQKIPFIEEKGKYGYYFLLFDSIKQIPEMRTRLSQAYMNDFETFNRALKLAIDKNEVRKDIDSTNLVYHISAVIEGFFYLNSIVPDIDFTNKIESSCNFIWNSIKTKDNE